MLYRSTAIYCAISTAEKGVFHTTGHLAHALPVHVYHFGWQAAAGKTARAQLTVAIAPPCIHIVIRHSHRVVKSRCNKPHTLHQQVRKLSAKARLSKMAKTKAIISKKKFHGFNNNRRALIVPAMPRVLAPAPCCHRERPPVPLLVFQALLPGGFPAPLVVHCKQHVNPCHEERHPITSPRRHDGTSTHASHQPSIHT